MITVIHHVLTDRIEVTLLNLVVTMIYSISSFSLDWSHDQGVKRPQEQIPPGKTREQRDQIHSCQYNNTTHHWDLQREAWVRTYSGGLLIVSVCLFYSKPNQQCPQNNASKYQSININFLYLLNPLHCCSGVWAYPSWHWAKGRVHSGWVHHRQTTMHTLSHS